MKRDGDVLVTTATARWRKDSFVDSYEKYILDIKKAGRVGGKR